MLQLAWTGQSCITEMKMYANKHRREIQKLSKNYLAGKNMTLDNYLASIGDPNFPFDELFLVLFARTFSLHVGVILSNKGFWCSTPWIPSRQCLVIFMYMKNSDNIGKLQLTLCAKCLNHSVCSCRIVKVNQAKSEYERELVNFVNPSDYPEKIPMKKLCTCKDVPTTKTHRLGTSSVKVRKDTSVTLLSKICSSTITMQNEMDMNDQSHDRQMSCSILCDIKENCNKLNKQVHVMQLNPKAYSTDYFVQEVKECKTHFT